MLCFQADPQYECDEFHDLIFVDQNQQSQRADRKVLNHAAFRESALLPHHLNPQSKHALPLEIENNDADHDTNAHLIDQKIIIRPKISHTTMESIAAPQQR